MNQLIFFMNLNWMICLQIRLIQFEFKSMTPVAVFNSSLEGKIFNEY